MFGIGELFFSKQERIYDVEDSFVVIMVFMYGFLVIVPLCCFDNICYVSMLDIEGIP